MTPEQMRAIAIAVQIDHLPNRAAWHRTWELLIEREVPCQEMCRTRDLVWRARMKLRREAAIARRANAELRRVCREWNVARPKAGR